MRPPDSDFAQRTWQGARNLIEPAPGTENPRPASHQKPQINVARFKGTEDVSLNTPACYDHYVVPMSDVPDLIVEGIQTPLPST